MLTMEFDYEKLAEAMRPVIREEIQAHNKTVELPPLLTRKEMMALLRITNNKAAELIARPDFPVNREAGLLFPKDKLFQWIDRHTQWVNDNTSYFNVG